MSDILYKDEVYEIVGICMAVYNELGYGFSEVVYKDAMEIEFIANGVEHQREFEFPVFYKQQRLGRTFFTDFTAFDKIIVEVKCNSEGITGDAFSQTLNYLKVSGYKLGLIINFGKRNLEYKRLIF